MVVVIALPFTIHEGVVLFVCDQEAIPVVEKKKPRAPHMQFTTWNLSVKLFDYDLD